MDQLKAQLSGLRNSVPVGFIYVQLPYQKSPKELWPEFNWTAITGQYAGLFFRAEGNGSKGFENTDEKQWTKEGLSLIVQKDDTPRITKFKTFSLQGVKKKGDGGWVESDIVKGDWSAKLEPGVAKNALNDIRFYQKDTENRPRNVAIRIWKRIN